MFGDERRGGSVPIRTATLPALTIGHSTACAGGAEPYLAGNPLAVVIDDSRPDLFSVAEFTEAVSRMCGAEPPPPCAIKHRSVLSAECLAEQCLDCEHACIHALPRYTGVRTSPRPTTSFTMRSSNKIGCPARRSSHVFTRTSIGTSR